MRLNLDRDRIILRRAPARLDKRGGCMSRRYHDGDWTQFGLPLMRAGSQLPPDLKCREDAPA
jgi:hypothetical protein